MNSLFWLSQNHIDEEYQTYLFQSFIQQVDNGFALKHLYPYSEELKKKEKDLGEFREKGFSFEKKFETELTGIDFKRSKLIYKKSLPSNELFNKTIEMAGKFLEVLKRKIYTASELKREIKDSLLVEEVGIRPLQRDFGFVALQNGNAGVVNLYEYKKSLWKNTWGLSCFNLRFYRNERLTIINTIDHMKNKMIRSPLGGTNPYVLFIQARKKIPQFASLLPIVKNYILPRWT